jgi:signal transduction histidine kinase/CheY-like chemotaxis protein/HPt (histidine-containing phosphotransfer) domain-containing protein
MHITFRNSIVLLLGISMLVIVVIGSIGVYFMLTNQDVATYQYLNVATRSRYLEEIKVNFWKSRTVTAQIVLDTEFSRKDTNLANLRYVLSVITEQFKNIQNVEARDENVKEMLMELDEDFVAYADTKDKILALAAQIKDYDSLQDYHFVFRTEMVPVFERVIGNIEHLTDYLFKLSTDVNVQYHQNTQAALACIITIFVVAVIILMDLGAYVFISITGIVKRITGFAVSISNEDFNKTLDAKMLNRRDEFGEMSQAMEKMRATLLGWRARVSEIHADLVASDEFARKSSARKSVFLANMSHEIRTPLTVIMGLSEMELGNVLPEPTRINLKKIYSSCSMILALVNDVLDISKIEADKFELARAPYDFASLVSDAISLNIHQIISKPIKFESNIDPGTPTTLIGDELRLRQVLYNLLSNAFKYTHIGKVTLTVSFTKIGSEVELVFTVKDTGIGIRSEDISKLFSEYGQIDPKASRHTSGTGLGLYICKQMIERMGGSISVESVFGTGSSFVATVRQEVRDPTPIGSEVVSNLKQFNFMESRYAKKLTLVRKRMPYGSVLIVDDVNTNQDVMKGLMKPYEIQINCAFNGREAIDIIAENDGKYDLIFMDHMMPEMDGVEALYAIRNLDTEYARTVPIVILTANARVGNAEMFLGEGFSDYLFKPVDVLKLDAILNRYIRDKQPEETLRLIETREASKEFAARQARDVNHKNADACAVILSRSIDGIDLEKGIVSFGGDALVYMGVLKSYMEHTPQLLVTIRSLAKPDDLNDYVIAIHGIKSSSYGISADKVGRLAEELEEAAKAGDFDKVCALQANFSNAADTLLAGLNELQKDMLPMLQISKLGQKPMPDRVVLEWMLEACLRYDIRAMQSALDELDKYSYEIYPGIVIWFKEMLDALEYEQIEKKLKELTNDPSFGVTQRRTFLLQAREAEEETELETGVKISPE